MNQTYSDLSFTYGGNSNEGTIFWQEPVTLTGPVTITMGNASKICSKQLKGIYYSNVRGIRLRPLDQESLTTLKLANTEYNNLTVANGLYTNCSGVDSKNVYGQVKRTRDGRTTTLNAGINYNLNDNDPIWMFASTMKFFDGVLIASGYIYDNIAGIAKIKDVQIIEMNCPFNDIYVRNAESVTGYKTATVEYGQACESETRTCINGVLGGTFPYANCMVGGADATPEAFVFEKTINAETGKLYKSNIITIRGITSGATSTGIVTNGILYINGVKINSSSNTVTINGDQAALISSIMGSLGINISLTGIVGTGNISTGTQSS